VLGHGGFSESSHSWGGSDRECAPTGQDVVLAGYWVGVREAKGKVITKEDGMLKRSRFANSGGLSYEYLDGIRSPQWPHDW